MNNASTTFLSFHSTGEFGRGYYRSHCGPTAITNLIISARQETEGRQLAPGECQEIFESVASYGRRMLIYNRKHGTTDLLLGFYVRAAFRNNDIHILRPGRRYTLGASNACKVLSRGSYMLLEVFGHPKYGWHQMLIYGTDDEGRFIAADGLEKAPVRLTDDEIGRGLFLEIRHS
ncbi:MAG: hypothetical protein II497_04620 [Lachnospiraceae bacterium]|nr:hypothetical protein [Lachnospiraceae bacterium]